MRQADRILARRAVREADFTISMLESLPSTPLTVKLIASQRRAIEALEMMLQPTQSK